MKSIQSFEIQIVVKYQKYQEMSTFMSTICCFLPDPRENSNKSRWTTTDEDSGRGSSNKVQTNQPERMPLIPSSSRPSSTNCKSEVMKKLQHQNVPSFDSMTCSGYQTFTCRSSDGGSTEETDDADDECSVDVNHLIKKINLMAGSSIKQGDSNKVIIFLKISIN